MRRNEGKKKLLYLAGEECTNGTGVAKKINNELKAFSEAGIETELVIVQENSKIKKIIPFSSSYRWDNICPTDVDFLYIRFEPLSGPFISMIKKWKMKNPNIRIVLEIGMYPYEDEMKKLSNPITLYRDKYYRKYIKYLIDRIAIFTPFNEVFGVPAIEMVNCISVDEIKIPKRKKYRADNTINIIAVASIAYFYGYDRLIKGLWNYYKRGGTENIVFHLVGEGDISTELKVLVNNLKLNEHVVFHGFKTGEELDQIYELADIGIDVLGGHRKGDIWFGTLKSREYMCKGLPFITEYTLPDDLKQIYRYILKVSDDESDIEVEKIVEFFNEMKQESRESTIKHMRDFAYSYCDISVAMKPVINYLLEEIE